MAELGEVAHVKIPRDKLSKLDPRWQRGIFLGRRDESAEVIIGTARGVEFSRSLRRMTDGERWSKEEYSTFIGAPWSPAGAAVEAPTRKARRYITQAMVAERGMTEGCQGCLGVHPHTVACAGEGSRRFLRS